MKKFHAKDSYIIRFFTFLTNVVYAVLSVSGLGKIFTSYSNLEQRFRSSGIGRCLNTSERAGSRGRRAVRRGIALAMERSILVRGVSCFWTLLCRSSLRTIGVFWITTGTYSGLMYWLFTFVWKSGAVDVMNLFWGAGFLLLGILLLPSEASLAFALTKSLFFGKLFVSGLGISDGGIQGEERNGQAGYAIAVPLGMVMGAISALTSPLHLIVGFITVLLFLMVLSIPETGVVLLLLLVPFVGFLPQRGLWLVLMTALPLIAYIGKLLRGNRAFHVEVQGLPVLLMMVLFLLCGVSVAGGSAWRGALLSVLLLAFYFLTVNVIATPRWMNRCRVALILSAAASAVIGIVQFVYAAVLAEGRSSFGQLANAVSAGFDDRIIFAYYLVIAFPFTLAAFVTDKNRYRLFTGLALLLILAASALAFVPGAIMALIIMSLVFLLIYERRSFPFVLAGGLASPLVILLLPSVMRRGLMGLLHTAPNSAFVRNPATRGLASRVFFDQGIGIFSRSSGFSRLLFGLGYQGPERFCALYVAVPEMQLAGSTSFWTYRLLEGGILGVILPAAFFFLLLQNCFSVLHQRGDKRFIFSAVVGIVMTVGVLVVGIFHYTWYDPAAMVLFFTVAALIAADGRCEREKQVVIPKDMNEDGYVAEMDYYGSGY